MRRLLDNQGFTLIELLVALPMLTIILGGLTTVFIQMQRSDEKSQEVATLQTEARSALTGMESDVRQGFVGDGSGPIITATATSITVLSPDNYPTKTSGSTMSSFHLRRLTYTVSGGKLTRQETDSTNVYPAAPPWTWPGTNGPTTTVMTSISNTDVFTFYTDSGIQANPDVPLAFPIADPSGIVAVRIKLKLTTKTQKATSFILDGLVGLRAPY